MIEAHRMRVFFLLMLALHFASCLQIAYNHFQEKGLTTIFIAMNPCWFGAGEMNRTPDLLITNELLYRLSYTGFRSKL